MKWCPRCERDRPVDDFAINRAKADGRQAWCRDCASTYNAVRYARRGPGDWRSQVINGGRMDKVRRRRWLIEYWQQHPCVDCGEADPVVLEFDHVRDVKAFNVSRGFYSKGWKHVLAEIEKCDSRCSNCHKRRTAKQFGWYANLDPEKVDTSQPLLPGGWG